MGKLHSHDPLPSQRVPADTVTSFISPFIISVFIIMRSLCRYHPYGVPLKWDIKGFAGFTDDSTSPPSVFASYDGFQRHLRFLRNMPVRHWRPPFPLPRLLISEARLPCSRGSRHSLSQSYPGFLAEVTRFIVCHLLRLMHFLVLLCSRLPTIRLCRSTMRQSIRKC